MTLIPHNMSAVPWPLLTVAIEVASEDCVARLDGVLWRLKEDDPAFSYGFDHESGQTLLGGTSEAHLETILDALIKTHGLELHVGAPEAVCRETISRKATIDHTYKASAGRGAKLSATGPVAPADARQLPGVSISMTPAMRRLPGGSLALKPSEGHFARVVLAFEPGSFGSGLVFTAAVSKDAVPEAFIPGVARGVETAAQAGLRAGFPVTDLRVTLTDGAWHDQDSSAGTFEIAAREAFRQLREKGGVQVLEPIMTLGLMTPQDSLAEVIADLAKRRGVVAEQETRDGMVLVKAVAPLVGLFGYSQALHSLTDGRAAMHMTYSHYAPVPETTSPDGVFPPAVGMRA